MLTLLTLIALSTLQDSSIYRRRLLFGMSIDVKFQFTPKKSAIIEQQNEEFICKSQQPAILKTELFLRHTAAYITYFLMSKYFLAKNFWHFRRVAYSVSTPRWHLNGFCKWIRHFRRVAYSVQPRDCTCRFLQMNSSNYGEQTLNAHTSGLIPKEKKQNKTKNKKHKQTKQTKKNKKLN